MKKIIKKTNDLQKMLYYRKCFPTMMKVSISTRGSWAST